MCVCVCKKRLEKRRITRYTYIVHKTQGNWNYFRFGSYCGKKEKCEKKMKKIKRSASYSYSYQMSVLLFLWIRCTAFWWNNSFRMLCVHHKYKSVSRENIKGAWRIVSSSHYILNAWYSQNYKRASLFHAYVLVYVCLNIRLFCMALWIAITTSTTMTITTEKKIYVSSSLFSTQYSHICMHEMRKIMYNKIHNGCLFVSSLSSTSKVRICIYFIKILHLF